MLIYKRRIDCLLTGKTMNEGTHIAGTAQRIMVMIALAWCTPWYVFESESAGVSGVKPLRYSSTGIETMILICFLNLQHSSCVKSRSSRMQQNGILVPFLEYRRPVWLMQQNYDTFRHWRVSIGRSCISRLSSSQHSTILLPSAPSGPPFPRSCLSTTIQQA